MHRCAIKILSIPLSAVAVFTLRERVEAVATALCRRMRLRKRLRPDRAGRLQQCDAM